MTLACINHLVHSTSNVGVMTSEGRTWKVKREEIVEDEGFWRKLPACCGGLTFLSRRSMGSFISHIKPEAQYFKGPPREFKIVSSLSSVSEGEVFPLDQI